MFKNLPLTGAPHMAIIQFHDDSGAPIDARFEVQPKELILHSRGGASGSPSARNTQYGPALRLLLKRSAHSRLTLDGVCVDSARARELPIEQRRIHFPRDTGASPKQLFTRLSKRMASVVSDSSTRRGRGNSTKRLRLAFAGDPSDEQVVRVAGWGETDAASSQGGPLPPAAFHLVTAEHIWNAVRRLCSGPVEHAFGKSRGYDVLANGESRLAPKVVFGLAASEAFGFEVGPQHFKGGPGTRCFKAIDRAGFSIVPKGEKTPTDEAPPDPEDRKWVEGQPRLRTHLSRERASGLARAKKEEFVRVHKRLYCEECGLKPDEVYGSDVGDACIEVHHKAPLHERSTEGETTLDDLMCVCANCHRIIHRKLGMQLQERKSAQ